MKQKQTILSCLLAVLILFGAVFGETQICIVTAASTPTSISASIAVTYLTVGKTLQINITTTPAKCKNISYTYTSDDESIATVSKKGVIKGISEGSTRICVSYSEYVYDYVFVTVTKTKPLTISGAKTFKAGKTYQLKASKDNVVWSIQNYCGENANASIDSSTGKLKIRNAGKIYVCAATTDGKYLGAINITATGPIISDQTVTLDDVVLKKDLKICDLAQLTASGLLPDTVTLKYTNGDETGKVDVPVTWKYFSYQDLDLTAKGTYGLYGSFTAPEGYLLSDISATQNVVVKKAQTDTRIKIVSIEDSGTVTLKKNLHITWSFDLINKGVIEDEVNAVDEDGNEVKLGIRSISYSDLSFFKKGTYDVELKPLVPAGYVLDGDLSSKLTVVIKKTQTYETASTTTTLDDIASESDIILPVTQTTIKK